MDQRGFLQSWGRIYVLSLGGGCWPGHYIGLINASFFLLLPTSRAMQKKYATGRPDQKDLNENLAATQGLAHMIVECNRLFEVEEPEMMQDWEGWVQYIHLPPSCVCTPAVTLTSLFCAPIRSLTKWLPSRATHTWRPTCMHPLLASCASS